jgi:hypothetical protein
MRRLILTFISGSIVPFSISAIFFSSGQPGAGFLCLAIGIAAIAFEGYRVRRRNRRRANRMRYPPF